MTAPIQDVCSLANHAEQRFGRDAGICKSSEDFEYRDIKRRAHDAVDDDFLTALRRP